MITYNENDLLIKAKEGDLEAQNKFLDDNKGLVHLIAKKFIGRGTDFEDLLQIGMFGLYKAMTNFDFNYNVKFSTYAVPMIAGEIKRFLRDDGIIKISRSIKDRAVRIRKETEKFEFKKGREPTVSELSKILGESVEDIITAISSNNKITSLDETNTQDDVNIIEKIEDKNQDDEDKIINKLLLKELILNLEIRERQIIILRYFKEMTQDEIAKTLNISQVQVCRLEKKILKKLKSEIENN